MKNKDFTVAELQEAINKRLGAFAGRKYEDTEFHSWYGREIAAEFEARGIKELRPSTWGVVADFTEQGLSLFAERAAEVNIDFKRDKRFKYSAGRGVILSMAVAFRAELLPLTLDGARRFLLEEKREECMKRCAGIRDEAMQEMQKAEAELSRLKGLVF